MPPAAEEGAAVVATLPPAVETSLETVPSPENPPLSSDLPSHPVLPSEIVESSAPDRPASEDTTAAMDAPAVTVPPTAVDAPQTEVLPESTPQELPSDTTTSQETSTEPQSEESTSPPPPPPPPQVEQTTPTEAAEEPADWADIEEDLSSPDEAELKEIEAAEGDYSAHEYDYWEKSFFYQTDDPEYRPSEKARLTWQIKGVRGTKEKPNRAKIMRSPPALVGGHWWTIKFFPRGNGVEALSIYVECSNKFPTLDKKLPDTDFKVLRGPPDAVLSDRQPDIQTHVDAVEDSDSWFQTYKSQYPCDEEVKQFSESEDKKDFRVSAQIGVIVYNPQEPRTGWMQSSYHQFNPHNPDWGWTNFHGPWNQIHRRKQGQRAPLMRNDTLAFDAYIQVFDDPTQSLWWHPSDSEPVWDSLALTGYRSIGDSVINHSVEVAGLAAWIHLAPFRKIIQSVDVLEHLRDCNVKPRPLCDALQKFLWLLRTQPGTANSVDTDKVTATLRNLHEFSSDVIEFWERLRRSLELELAGTDAAAEFAKLFDSPSNSTEDGLNTLPAHLLTRVRIEADKAKTTQAIVNQYLGEKPGCWALPPILHVDLARQQFDHASRQWKMLYNRVDLDETLDLAPFTLYGQCGQYSLYGYVIHRGRRTSGKFFSILRPGGPGSKWLAFDDGTDNRVECLTRMGALESHVGLEDSKLKDVNEKTGHDAAVAVLYVRNDVVNEYLPGPLEPWDVSPDLKAYLETGSYTSPEATQDAAVNVEVYSLAKVDDMNSLFDSYDLMAKAKSTDNVTYLSVPRTTTLVELRKQIAGVKSTDSDEILPEHIRLWEIGQTKDLFGSTLVLDRQSDLERALDVKTKNVRFWMHILSGDDVKLFSMPDPPKKPVVVEQKTGGTVEVQSAASDSEDENEDTGANPTADSTDVVMSDTVEQPAAPAEPAEPAEPTEPAEPAAPEAMEDVQREVNAQPATIATEEPAAAATAESPSAAAVEDSTSSSDSENSERSSGEQSTGSSTPTEVDEAEQVKPETPVPHIYYFIQMFDMEKQEIRVLGSFISRLESNIKAAIREKLEWPADKDFLLWARVDGTSVTAVSPADTFWTPVRDGICFIVGEKLNKKERAALGAAGSFTNPERLVQYMWASSRNHPTQAFTGMKTIDATFNGDYYSGEFNKGYYHGKGTHISNMGVTYEGQFIFGQRHGVGKMEYPSGDTYEGDWVEDQRHGLGTFIEKRTGNKYVGGYKDGKRHGKGISYWEVADEEMDLCQICYSEDQDALFYDCGHVCACVTCARQVDICPICRKKVLSVVKIYKM